MHPQRALFQPHFYHQFTPLFATILEFNASYKTDYIDWQIIYKQDVDAWQKQINHLNELAAKGGVVEAFTYQTLDRQIEKLTVQKSKNHFGSEKLEGNINITWGKLCGFFPEIRDDYEGAYMNLFTYRQYLQKYQQVIESGNGLKCFSTPPVNEIQKEITKHLPVKTA